MDGGKKRKKGRDGLRQEGKNRIINPNLVCHLLIRSDINH